MGLGETFNVANAFKPMKKYNTNKAIVYDSQGIELLRNRQLKTLIATGKSVQHLGQEIAICDKDKVYGIVVLNEPIILDKDLFENHFSRHHITKEFKEEVWPSINKFFSHSFRIKKIFKEPLDYVYKGDEVGMGDFVADISIIQEPSIDYTALETIKNIIKYEDKLEMFDNMNCKSEDEELKSLFVDLYKLFIIKLANKNSESK